MQISSNFKHALSNLRSQEQGSALIIIAVSIVALLGFAGLTIDFGYFFLQKARMQALADASVLACAQFDCDHGDPRLNKLNETYDMTNVELIVNKNATCPDGIDGDCLAVDIKKDWTPFFISKFGVPKLTVNVSAKAIGGEASEPEPIVSTSPVLMALNESQSGIQFIRNSGEGFKVTGSVVSNKATAPSMTANYWSGLSQNIPIQGDLYLRTSTDRITPASGFKTETISSPMSDPCGQATFPTESFCTGNDCWYFDNKAPNCHGLLINKTLKVPAGKYARLDIKVPSLDAGLGLINSCTYVFEGVYTVRDGMSIHVNGAGGGVETKNAVFVFADGASPTVDIQMRGTMSSSLAKGNSINMTAPTSGNWRGILFYRKNGNFEFNGINLGDRRNSVSMNGIVYAPKGQIRVNKKGEAGSSLMLSNVYGANILLENYQGDDVTIKPLTTGNICEGASTEDPGNSGGSGHSGRSRLVN